MLLVYHAQHAHFVHFHLSVFYPRSCRKFIQTNRHSESRWPRVMKMLILDPIQSPVSKRFLVQPSQSSLVHPLYPNLALLVCQVWGDYSKNVDFHSCLAGLSILERKYPKQYNRYIKRWQLHCRKRQIESISAAVEKGANFLAELYKTNVSYSALNVARSALSSHYSPSWLSVWNPSISP